MESDNQKDFELVTSFINSNDMNAIETLINRHKKKVYTYIVLIVKNHQLAEDLFQETFIKVIRSLKQGKYQEKGTFSSWIVRIAHNLIIDHYRKQKHLKMVSHDNGNQDLFNTKKFSDSTIEDDLVLNQIHQDVRNLIDYLPDDQKQVVLLRHYGGLSFKEIAEQTEVSINTALGRMRYALINLRKLITEKNLTLTIE